MEHQHDNETASAITDADDVKTVILLVWFVT